MTNFTYLYCMKIEDADYTFKHSKRFHNCYYLLLKLTYQERYLLDWLTEQAIDSCEVETDYKSRKKFIDFILRMSHYSGEKEILYKDSSVKYSIGRLKKIGLLIAQPSGRGIMWVNPLFMFQGNQEHRNNMIIYINRKLEEIGESRLQDRTFKLEYHEQDYSEVL